MAPDPPNLFINEAKTYQYDCISRYQYIRSLCEYVNNGDNHYLALEWMDSTLWETKDKSNKSKANIFKTVAKSCLEALVAFRNIDGNGGCVHGGEQIRST